MSETESNNWLLKGKETVAISIKTFKLMTAVSVDVGLKTLILWVLIERIENEKKNRGTCNIWWRAIL